MARPRTRRRIELGWFEAVVLMLGYVVSLGIVGVGGVYVGQRAVQQRVVEKDRIQRLPAAGAGSASTVRRPSSEEPDITFYETLGKAKKPPGEGRVIIPDAAQTRPTPPERRAAAPQAAPSQPAPTDHPGDVEPSEESAEKRVEAPKPASREEAPQAARAPAEEAPPVPKPPHGVTAEAAATARALLAIPSGAAPAPKAKGAWSVQVNATRDGDTAERQARELRTRGYEAFVVTQVRDGEMWYRVRVGHLPDLETANSLVSELKTREGLPHAFVASD